MNSAILVNCNVDGYCQSVHHSDLILIANEEEDAYKLNLLSQKLDTEIWILRLFGLVDPKSGKLLFVIVFNSEDTGALEKSLGRPGARSAYRWIFSTVGKEYHIAGWHNWHCPFDMTTEWCQFQWSTFRDDKFQQICDSQCISVELGQYDSSSLPEYEQAEKRYKEVKKQKESHAKKKNRKHPQASCGRAEDAHSLGMFNLLVYSVG